MGTTKPITPEQVMKLQEQLIPDVVIQVFNSLIAENMVGTSSSIQQKDIIARINQNTVRGQIPSYWLNIKAIYEKVGWKVKCWEVECDRPGHNESYDTTFTFTKN